MTRRHDVVVRRKTTTVLGYGRLKARLAAAYEKVRAVKGESGATGFALMALSQFLVDNGEKGPIPVWLAKVSASLLDVDYGGKTLSSNEWRQFALIFLGMKALIMGGIGRKEAARRAHHAVKTDVSEVIVLGRYDELLKGRIKNPEAQRLLRAYGGDELAQLVKSKGFEAASKHYFDLARLVRGI
jgi:hypothetical protein